MSRSYSAFGIASLGLCAPAWSVLNVSRQRFTIDTGRITPKRGSAGPDN
ncbi:MAG: hypothetical protein ABIP93_19500 [Gemmatimonadaceae bacterium]